MSAPYARLADAVARIEGWFDRSFPGRMLLLAVVVGVAGGLGAVVFRYLLIGITFLVFGVQTQAALLDTVESLPWYYRILAPAAGGMLVGLIVLYTGDRQASGEGVPQVRRAMHQKDGIIPARIAPAKTLTAAICIGSGNSAGREGPVIQIGGTFGSIVGQRLDLTGQKRTVLISAGAAAGLGGTFNAPIGGAVFVLEILLGRFTRKAVFLVGIASLVGTATANVIVGLPDPVFSITGVEVASYWEVLAYAGLGVIGAAAGLLYTYGMHWTGVFFEKLPVSDLARPAVGGLCFGVLALYVPQIYATGYPVIQGVLVGTFTVETLVVIGLAKIVATSITLGSGGSGGIFAPALVIGGVFGSAYGTALQDIFPTVIGNPTTYAAVGMGALFAATAHAPLTAIVIVYELTGDGRVIPPLVVACLISMVVARRVGDESIYTIGTDDDGTTASGRFL